MNGQPILRPVAASDHAFLLELVASTRDDLSLLDPGVSAMLVRMQVDAQLSDYRRRFPGMEESIVLVNGVRAGRLYVARQPDEIRLLDICLVPAFRRRRIGSALLASLQEQSVNAGLPLRLQVLQGNPAARLYRRLGFQPGEADGIYLAMEWHPILIKE